MNTVDQIIQTELIRLQAIAVLTEVQEGNWDFIKSVLDTNGNKMKIEHFAYQVEKPAEAARYFMRVAILYDDAQIVPECLYQAGLAFGKSENPEEQRKAFQELLKRYPDSSQAKRATAGEQKEPQTPNGGDAS